MPVLLLAQGDPEAKDLLRRAIDARYGKRPPAIEALRVDFKGRARLTADTWTPLDVTARFAFPEHLRWDFVVKLIDRDVIRGIEAYDGHVFRAMRNNKAPRSIDQTKHLKSIRARLWTMAAILLTPMSDFTVKVTKCGEYCFDAENTQLNDTVRIYLREDYSVEKAQTRCWNPDTQREQLHTIFLSTEQKIVNDMVMPKMFGAFWDRNVAYEMTPIRVQRPHKIDTDIFTLQQLAVTG